MRELLKTLALVLFGIAVGLIISELAIRIFVPQRVDSIRPLWEADPYLVFRLRKNLRITYSQFEFVVQETTNSIGLRDKEIARKARGVYRFLGLGDSYSYANGVNLEDTYFKNVEKCLTELEHRPIEVINCAVPANSLLQEVGYLEKYGLSLEPDAIILGFYVGNDFTDSYYLFDENGKQRVSIEDGLMVSSKLSDKQPGLRGILLPVRMLLATQSHLYILVRNRFSELLARVGLRSIPPAPDFCAKEFSANVRKGWELDQYLLLKLSAFVQQHRMRLVIVVLPEIYQVYENAWNKYLTTFSIDATLYDLGKPQRLMKSFCAENDIECVDVLPEMQVAARTAQLFYPIDSHMNPEGHRFVSQVLCKYFARTSRPHDNDNTHTKGRYRAGTH